MPDAPEPSDEQRRGTERWRSWRLWRLWLRLAPTHRPMWFRVLIFNVIIAVAAVVIALLLCVALIASYYLGRGW